jgi:hypothetical protein
MEMDMMCRRTLLGHKDDVTSLSAVGLRRRRPDGSASPGHLSPAPSAAASPRGGGPGAGGGGGGSAMLAALVARASADGTVRVWCAPNWTCLRVLIASPPLMPSGGSLPAGVSPGLLQSHQPALPPGASYLGPAAAAAAAAVAGQPGASAGAVPTAGTELSSLNSAAAGEAACAGTAQQQPAAAAAAGAHPSAAPPGGLPPAHPGHHAAAGAAGTQHPTLRLPTNTVAPLKIGHSSFASFDFSGDDFSFGGSHASRPAAGGSVGGPSPLQRLHHQQPAPQQTQVGFVVDGSSGADGGATAADGAQQQQRQASGSALLGPPHAPHSHAAQAQAHAAGGGPPAALCVAVARGLVAAGFVDGQVRLWHIDDMCGIAAEAVGRAMPSTPPPGALGGGAFVTHLDGQLSMTGGADLQSFISSQPASGFLAGGSPPPSPHARAGGPLGLLGRVGPPAGSGGVSGSSGAGGGLHPHPHGQQQVAALSTGASVTCARLRAGTLTSSELDGANGAAPGHCGACGSMDQNLVRALKELVAIRTVSSSHVSFGFGGQPRFWSFFWGGAEE